MSVLVAGLLVFLGVHSVSIINVAWRDRMAARLGEPAWQGLYGLVAVAGFALIVWGYGLARAAPIVLYTPPAGLRHVALLLMVVVFPLLLAAYLPGRIQAAARHPMLLATKVWALAHLLANGSLADVVLFGSFLAWAVADRISLKRRTPRPVPGAPPGKANDLIATVGGIGLYVAFLIWLHPLLFGVSPLG
jgi:uncharacterized membrane protein